MPAVYADLDKIPVHNIVDVGLSAKLVCSSRWVVNLVRTEIVPLVIAVPGFLAIKVFHALSQRIELKSLTPHGQIANLQVAAAGMMTTLLRTHVRDEFFRSAGVVDSLRDAARAVVVVLLRSAAEIAEAVGRSRQAHAEADSRHLDSFFCCNAGKAVPDAKHGTAESEADGKSIAGSKFVLRHDGIAVKACVCIELTALGLECLGTHRPLVAVVVIGRTAPEIRTQTKLAVKEFLAVKFV